eukprot:10269725-Prorocentrum_lima.AAC.1
MPAHGRVIIQETVVYRTWRIQHRRWHHATWSNQSSYNVNHFHQFLRNLQETCLVTVQAKAEDHNRQQIRGHRRTGG